MKSSTSKKNDPGVGGQYEINVPAYFALKLNSSQDVKDFSIRSNASGQFGNLDDVIIDVTLENGESLNFAFQLKHRGTAANISPTQFESKGGKLSLEKYHAAYKDMPEDLQKRYHFILYTCQNFDSNRRNEVRQFTMLEDDQCPGKRFFNTSSDMKKNTYKFEVTKEASTSDGADTITKFFSKLTLYTCQKKFAEFEKLIFVILKNQKVVDGYLTLFRKWQQGLFSNKTIDRQTINDHLINIYLSDFIMMDRRLSDDENSEMYFFEQATKQFDVTVIDDSKEKFCQNLKQIENVDGLQLKIVEDSRLKKYKSKYKMTPASTLTDCMLRLAKEYKFIEKTEPMDEETKNKIFCFYFQQQLIIDFNQFSAEAVYNLMEIYQANKEDKITFVLVGHAVDLTKFSSRQVFHNLEDLSTEGKVYEDITTVGKISFNGSTSISLKDIIQTFDDVKSVFGTKQIVEMINSNCSVGEQKTELPLHYVSRKVSATVFDLDAVSNVSKDDTLIVILNFRDDWKPSEEELHKKGIHLVEISKYNQNRRSFVGKPIIITTKEKSLGKEAEDAIIEGAGRSIHIFKMVTQDTFILIKNSSQIDCTGYSFKKFPQEEIHSVFDATLNLLVAEPGMGKTTFMKYLRNECPWNSWPVYTHLMSHSAFLSQTHTSEEVLEHFMKMEPEESNFLRGLKNIFMERRKVILFLDGLDELPTECVENVLHMVGNLLDMGHHVWLSSRQNLEGRLAERFKMFILRMVELDEEEQRTYIQNRLRAVYEEEEITEFVDRIFRGIEIANNEQFLGIPLQLYILTQIFLDERKARNDITQNFFVLTKLYQCFFKGRFHHCFEKYQNEAHCPFLSKAAAYLEQYELIALECILNEPSFEKLQLDCRSHKRFLNIIQTEKDPLGIVSSVNNGRAIFGHQTFAEYFACVWLKNNKGKVKLLKDELFSQSHEHLRVMFNMIMAENNPLHLSIIYKNVTEIRKEDLDSLDEGGRTALHIACSSGTVRFCEALFKHPKGEPQWYITLVENLFEKKPTISEEDKLFSLHCLDYAFESENLFPIEVALSKGGTMFSTWSKKWLNKYDSEIMIFYCSKFGYPNLLEATIKENPESIEVVENPGNKLLEIAMNACCFNTYEQSNERFINTVEILVDNEVNINQDIYFPHPWKPGYILSLRPLHMAYQFGQFKIAKKLLELQASMADGLYTALHAACERKVPNDEIIMFFLNNGLDINAPSNMGETPFHLACRSVQFGIVNYILQQEKPSVISAILRTSDKNGNNALHFAARSEEGNKEIIALLINKGIAVDSQNEVGNTPLHEACGKCNVVNIEQLLKMGAKANFTNQKRSTALVNAITSRPGKKKVEEKVEIIDLFLKYNKDILAKHGQKLVDLACIEGYPRVVEKLIDSGAKIGKGAWIHANFKKNKEIIDILRSKLMMQQTELIDNTP